MISLLSTSVAYYILQTFDLCGSVGPILSAGGKSCIQCNS